MPKWLNAILGIFQNMDGSTSARRVVGIILVAVAIYGFFAKVEKELVLAFLGTGWAAITVTTFDKHPPVAPEEIPFPPPGGDV